MQNKSLHWQKSYFSFRNKNMWTNAGVLSHSGVLLKGPVKIHLHLLHRFHHQPLVDWFSEYINRRWRSPPRPGLGYQSTAGSLGQKHARNWSAGGQFAVPWQVSSCSYLLSSRRLPTPVVCPIRDHCRFQLPSVDLALSTIMDMEKLLVVSFIIKIGPLSHVLFRHLSACSFVVWPWSVHWWHNEPNPQLLAALVGEKVALSTTSRLQQGSF